MAFDSVHLPRLSFFFSTGPLLGWLALFIFVGGFLSLGRSPGMLFARLFTQSIYLSIYPLLSFPYVSKNPFAFPLFWFRFLASLRARSALTVFKCSLASLRYTFGG
ncbi:hypothetical protein BDY21DRAFT_342715 [Lineolata rhizophorae]|uniref:Uncharacterized protein n=1 Tax=Lineolata rhizophorae TaxID=578093 RepID=A0A6A6P2T5_9PEZI|nr:hypothetical protein BDY21DRAFT_342715 [Lineolata rhizophorae]